MTNLNDPTRILEDIDQGMTAQSELRRPRHHPRPVTPTPTPTPTRTPGKFGTPTVIAADPYIIDQNTTIQTDPTITKNGVTDFGKIYRGQAVDGLGLRLSLRINFGVRHRERIRRRRSTLQGPPLNSPHCS